MKSTKKYFNSSKGFNKRIKKQASALPTAAQTTTMQTTANQGQAQADLAQANALQIEAINQQLRVQEERERQLAEQREAEATQAISSAASQVPSIAKTLAKEGGEEVAKRFATTGSGLAKSSTAVAPLALGATLVGEGLKYFGGDDDPTTYNVAETSGGLLSGAGKGASYGALAGSIIPGVGNILGAVLGAPIGLGVNAVKMLKDRKEAREQAEKEKASQMQRDYMFGQRAQELFGQAFTTQGRDLGFNVGSSASNSYLPGFQRESGGKKVPGGVIKPLPFGAVEFRGNKHGEAGRGSDSGIILEEGGKMSPGVEVEDKETMDKVKFANGKEDDYIFSSYLKLGGKSFAQRHKEILQSGGDQEQIQNLAKMQEEKAKEVKKTPVGPTDQYGPRGQEYIARYGGVRKKLQGGEIRWTEPYIRMYTEENKNSAYYGRPKDKPGNLNIQVPNIITQLDSVKRANAATAPVVPLNPPKKQYGGRMKAQGSLPPEQQARVEESKNLMDAIEAGAIQAGDYEGAEVAAQSAAANAAAANTPVQTPANTWGIPLMPDPNSYTTPYIQTIFPFLNPDSSTTTSSNSSSQTAATASTTKPTEATTPTTEFDGQGLTPENTPNLPAGLEWFVDDNGKPIIVNVGQAEVETKKEEKKEEKTDEEPKKEPEKKNDPILNIPPPRVRDVPPLAYLGTAAQLLGPLMALKTSYPEPSQKISAGVQGLTKLGRVNFNAERAANLNSATAANRFIQNTNAGPAAIASTIAGNNAAREGSMQLASQEARTNMQLANAEEQINANIVAQNMARDLQAQGLNAEAQNMLDRLEYEKRINAFDTMGAIGAQFASDVMQYKAAEREARANQIAGEYTREGYVTAMQNRPKYKRMLKKAGIDPNDTRAVQRIAAGMYNPNMTLEEQEEMFRQYIVELNKSKEKEDRKFGGYIKKYGKVSKK